VADSVTGSELTTLAIDRPADGVAVLRIDRPEKLNAQTVRMFTEFGIAARMLAEDVSVRAVVLTGTGVRAFSAGFDLGEIDVIADMGARSFLKFQETATEGIQAIRHLPVPVIAAVHGAAVGGGLALALAADLRLVAPTAKFSAAFIKMGLSMGELGTSVNLAALVGPAKAAEFGWTGRMIGADEALRTGLANRVVPTDDLLDEAIAMASSFAERDRGELSLAKTVLQRAAETPSFRTALDLEITAHALAAAAGSEAGAGAGPR
jgi:enoyl-CoA hydratase/carnithine racemase